MILVVVVMAMAAIMGFALLSSASLQAEAARNSTNSYTADGLAQSGTNLAVYYLMNPDQADKTLMKLDSPTGKKFYSPGSNVPTMSVSNGAYLSKLDLAVKSNNGTLTTYTIDSTSNSGTLSGSLSRTQHSTVDLISRYLVKYQLASNGAFSIPITGVSMTVGGNVRADGGIGGLLSAISGSTIIPANTPKPTYPDTAVPSYSQLNVCKYLGAGTYMTATGSVGTVQTVSGTISSFPVANAGNPDAVYYSSGPLTIGGSSAITLNGTLVVRDGNNLTINNSAGVTINTKKTGQPALVVGGNLNFNGLLLTSRTLTVNGLAWIGGDMTQTGIATNVYMTVNGALMWASSSPGINTGLLLGSSYIHVNAPTTGGQTMDYPNYDLLYVPLLSNENQIPKSIKLVSTNVN